MALPKHRTPTRLHIAAAALLCYPRCQLMHAPHQDSKLQLLML